MSTQPARKNTSEAPKGFLDAITCHCFNADKSMVALCPNNTDIVIYDCKDNSDPFTWKKLFTLGGEHTSVVSGIDWCPATNAIVTCGHDRNAYVWNFDGKDWKPTLCVLKSINRAATCVRWSPSGLKFAVASGSRQVAICSYEASSDWWVSKVVKKHASTIVDVAWSPNSRFIATACTDGKARIASAFLKKLDKEQSDMYESIFPKQYELGEILAESPAANAWVNTVAWSPDGETVAFGGHGSTVSFWSIPNGLSIQTVSTRDLPFLSSTFLDNNTYVAAGFDYNPAVFTRGPEGFAFKAYMESGAKKAASPAASSSATSKAFNIFQQADLKGHKLGDEQATASPSASTHTTHKGVIVSLVKDHGSSTGFSTAGMDGRIVQWDVSTIKG